MSRYSVRDQIRSGRGVGIPARVVLPGGSRLVLIRPGLLGLDFADQHRLAAAVRRRLLAERLVDLEQHLLLPLGELWIGQHRLAHPGTGRPVLQEARLDVERLRRYPQPAGDLLQDVGARAAQAPLDLAQVRVGDARRLGQLAERDLGLLPLLADVGSDRWNINRTHVLSLAPSACICKPLAELAHRRLTGVVSPGLALRCGRLLVMALRTPA